jgi:hypothetical protein
MVQVSCGAVDRRDCPLAVRTLIFSSVPRLAALIRAERKSAGRNWPADGVVTICGTRGRLACAVIVTSGFVAARPAGLFVGETGVRADDEEIQG